MELQLPDSSFSARHPTFEDLDIVIALTGECELADLGKRFITKTDIAGDWSRPGFDLQRDALLVFKDGRLIANAESFATRAEVNVHPSVRPTGLLDSMFGWVEDLGRKRGENRVRYSVFDRATDNQEALRSRGYEVLNIGWLLEIELNERPQDPEPPEGISLRRFNPGEEREMYQVIQDAFNEWPDREPTAYADWAASTIDRSDFDPALIWVALDGTVIVGVCLGVEYPDEGGWVQQLAVKARHRHRGIARALLQRAFLLSWERGRSSCGLSTDSRTGALTLYQKVGMEVRSSTTTFAIDLDPEGSLATEK
jgi:GNAT superfamily N-acetyltransferase